MSFNIFLLGDYKERHCETNLYNKIKKKYEYDSKGYKIKCEYQDNKIIDDKRRRIIFSDVLNEYKNKKIMYNCKVLKINFDEETKRAIEIECIDENKNDNNIFKVLFNQFNNFLRYYSIYLKLFQGNINIF